MAAPRHTVAQLIPALDSGGAERSTLEIAAALVGAGHRALVVSAGGRLVPRLEALGAEHVALPVGRKSLASLALVPALARLFAAREVSIVHARSRLPAWLGWLALGRLVRARPRFVTTVHGLNSPGRYSAILARGERVICVSETVRAHLRRHYPSLPDAVRVVIPRGIDLDAFPRAHRPGAAWLEALGREHPVLLRHPVLLMPARGTRLKGHAEAIELLARLEARGVAAALWLPGAREAGRERYLAGLEALAAARGVAGRVVLSPPRADIADCLAHAAVVLQLSTKPESFGRTVIEAAAIGRPVVGWAHGGVGELLAELYPAGAVAPFEREALAARVADELARPGTPAPPLGYPLAAMQRATLALYDELVAAPR